VISGTEVVWQKPVPGPPVGLLLLFHGCTHRASHFFQLPEERIIVSKALQLGLAVAAFSSGEHVPNYCWDNSLPAGGNLDVKAVGKALQTLLGRESWTKLPLFAFGASSGGSFATVFPLQYPVLASTVQISSGNQEALQTFLAPNHVRSLYFSHMVRDKRTAAIIQSNVPRLVAKGFEVEVLEVQPRPLTPTYFSEFIKGVTPEESRRMFAALKNNSFVIGKDDRYYLSEDQRTTPRVLEFVAAIKEDYRQELEEELNVLWGTHELTSDGCDLWLQKMVDHIPQKN